MLFTVQRLLVFTLAVNGCELTSCSCRTLERMVNSRLLWGSSNPKVDQHQSSAVLEKKRSTADHLVRFDCYIHEAFVEKEYVISTFFDLEKAYDTT